MTVRVAHAADSAVQRLADASVWLIFRIDEMRSSRQHVLPPVSDG